MEISIERDTFGDGDRVRRVLILWTDTGPFLCLTEDGTLTEQYRPTGEVIWDSDTDEEQRLEQLYETAYQDGFQDGQRAARTKTRTTAPVTQAAS